MSKLGIQGVNRKIQCVAANSTYQQIMRPPLQPQCLDYKSCAVATTGSPMKKLCCLGFGLQQWIRNISVGVELQKQREYCCCKNC